jgi:hypothetical protein
MNNDQFNKQLPDFLRDFHDQKDFFKAMHAHYSKEGQENKIPGNWIDNHIYTIDFFLWLMALNGYRLQRFKSKHFEQNDINNFIAYYTEQRSANFAKIISDKLNDSKENEN